jgi:hypothetical protein
MYLSEFANKINAPGAYSVAPDAEKCLVLDINAKIPNLVKPLNQSINSTNGDYNSSSFSHSLFNNHRTLLPGRVLQDAKLFPTLAPPSKSNRFCPKLLFYSAGVLC